MTSSRPDTRTHLVNTATSLFLNKSYGTISTSKICTSAEVNKGTFYHFFPSKAALLIAALEKYTAEAVAQLHQIQHCSLSPEQKLKALFDVPANTNAVWLEENAPYYGCLISNIAHELSTVDEQIRVAAARCLHDLIEAAKPVVKEYCDSNNVSLDVGTATERVVALLQGGLTMAKLFKSNQHLQRLAEQAGPALLALNNQEDREVVQG